MCPWQPFKGRTLGPRGFISVSKPTPWAVTGPHGQLASINIVDTRMGERKVSNLSKGLHSLRQVLTTFLAGSAFNDERSQVLKGYNWWGVDFWWSGGGGNSEIIFSLINPFRKIASIRIQTLVLFLPKMGGGRVIEFATDASPLFNDIPLVIINGHPLTTGARKCNSSYTHGFRMY